MRRRDRTPRGMCIASLTALLLVVAACSNPEPNATAEETKAETQGTTESVDECADAMITAEVKSMILAKEGLAAFDINVETEECVVTLKGCVDTDEQRTNSADVASKAAGVRTVRNELTLCEQP